MLAVIFLIALVMAVMVPDLGATRSAALRQQARSLASSLEFARQRAVMTGRTHRLLVAVDDGMYQVEWMASESEALGDGSVAVEEPLDLAGATPLPMAAPRGDERDFRPVPTSLGRPGWLDEGMFFEGVDTPEGWIDAGDVGVVFQRDGSTDAARVVIADEDGRRAALEVRPLQDRVRILEGDDAT